MRHLLMLSYALESLITQETDKLVLPQAEQRTALHLAMFAGVKPDSAAATARLLLAHGAPVNAQSKVYCLLTTHVLLIIELMC